MKKDLPPTSDSSGQLQQLGTWHTAFYLFRHTTTGEGPWILAGLMVLLASSAIALLQPWPLKLIVDAILGSQEPLASLSNLSILLSQNFPWPSDTKMGLLLLLCACVLVIQLLMGTLMVLSTYILVAVGLRMVFRLRCRLFDHLQRLSLAFHDTTAIGDSLYRMTWDTYCVQALFNSGLIPALTASFTLLGIASIMFFLDWLLTIVALAIGIPLVILIQKLDRPMQERTLRAAERESNISSRVQETLSSIRAIQAFGRERAESQRFSDYADASLRAKLRLTVLQAWSQAMVGLLLAGGTAAVVWIAGQRVLQGLLTVGDVVLLVSYLAMLYQPLQTLAITASTVQSAAASARRVFSILDATPEVMNKAEAFPLTARTSGPIVFEHVSFAYNKGRQVLKDICLEIAPGQTVALVGPSGAGKTTIANLFMRFYDPTEGRITLNGINLQSLTLESLRQNMALVLQEPVLFSSTIRENIAYGRPNATNEEIEAAARAAGAHDFIQTLPRSYETQIGERGVALSGGQRQRLSIARAFLKDAPILILDEPTSALDSATEQQVLEALNRLMKDRTTLIIAHRLSTVRHADQIVVVQDGRIAEIGSHGQLLIGGRLYTELYSCQAGHPAAV